MFSGESRKSVVHAKNIAVSLRLEFVILFTHFSKSTAPHQVIFKGKLQSSSSLNRLSLM